MKGHPSYFLFLAVVAGVMEDGNYSYFMKTTPTHPSPSILEHQIACLEQYLSHNPYLEQPMESNLLNNPPYAYDLEENISYPSSSSVYPDDDWYGSAVEEATRMGREQQEWEEKKNDEEEWSMSHQQQQDDGTTSRLASLKSYDWDIYQRIDNLEWLNSEQKTMWKDWLVELKTRWNDALEHYVSRMVEELKQQHRFRTVTEEERQALIRPIVQAFEDAWKRIRKMMVEDGLNRMRRETRASKRALVEWFLQHAVEPYPTEEDKQLLAMQTGWTIHQVNYW